MQIYLNQTQFKNKPKSWQIADIQTKIQQEIIDINPSELAEEIAKNGKTVMLATYPAGVKSSINQQIAQQSILMLDFDNKESENYISLSQILNNQFILDNACFAYNTFNSAKFSEKFRIVFVLKEPLKSSKEVIDAYKYLFNLFPQADNVVGQPNRLFFGSNSGYEVINWDNRLDLSNQIKEASKPKIQTIIKIHKNNDVTAVGDIVDYLKTGDYDSAKSIIADKYKGTAVLNNSFLNEYSAQQFYKTEVSLVDFLDLPTSKSFNCILFEDNNPSASVFKSDTNIDLYTNFSKNFKADLTKLIAKLTGKSVFDAIDLLLYLTDSTIVSNSQIQKQIRAVDFLIKNLKSPDLKDNYPSIFKFLNKDLEVVFNILEIVADYKYFDSNGQIQIMSYLTVDSLTHQINHRISYKNITKEKVVKCMCLLTLTEVLIKHQVKEIDSQLIAKIDKDRQSKNIDYKRYPNFLSINAKNDIDNIESIFEDLESKKFTITGSLNFEWLYTNYNKEVAVKVFPQKFTKNTDLNKIADKHVITADSQAKIETIMSVINTYMIDNDTNFIKQSTLIDILKANKFPKAVKNLTKYRNYVAFEFINYYNIDLKLAKGNQALKEILNIDKKERLSGLVFYY